MDLSKACWRWKAFCNSSISACELASVPGSMPISLSLLSTCGCLKYYSAISLTLACTSAGISGRDQTPNQLTSDSCG